MCSIFHASVRRTTIARAGKSVESSLIKYKHSTYFWCALQSTVTSTLLFARKCLLAGSSTAVYNMASLRERYEAAMVLAGTGDCLGYKNGSWEFCHSGEEIFKEVTSLGGLKKLKLKLPGWMVSDDTVMLLATGEALSDLSGQPDKDKLFTRIAEKYKECMKDMAGRAPGASCKAAAHQLKPLRKQGYRIPFNARGGGCGAAMRSSCIGLRYPRPSDLKDLVAVSVESGRMTHNHPTGYLGSLASALFTSLAIQGRPLKEWGRCLLETLPLALSYVTETGHCVDENRKAWAYFTKAWTDYLTLRNILDGDSDPVFPEAWGFSERDKFYKSVSYSGWGGSSGHDAPMIAYDALLGANWDWEELSQRGMFHGGDSDSTGIIAACCYGAVQGFKGVPEANHKYIEYRDRLVQVANRMLLLAEADEPANSGNATTGSSGEIGATGESATGGSAAGSQESTSTTDRDSSQSQSQDSVAPAESS
ncbi:ADP-ribosylhydrolase ARH1-like isoform X3 [Littorina saxatilis]|uniref:ADP-ribosylhydrolase ARH1-like isoform X3 n=1 Tax=Littorina saxatilis TaxID=31220 RepID=UPI0038B5FE70